MRVVAVYNLKGGVGKTSTAVNLAYLASRDGVRTLLWDLDPQGAATYLFRVKARVKGGGRALVRGRHTVDDAIKGTDFEGLDLMPADFTYRNLDLDLDAARRPTGRLGRLLAPLGGEYDLVVLDCPPSASLVSENVLRASDLLLVPLVPAVLSLRTLDQVCAFVAATRGPRSELLAFLSMVDRRKKAHRDLADRLPGENPAVSRVSVPNLAVVEQMAEHRAPVPVYAPLSPATRAYRDLWAEVLAHGTGQRRARHQGLPA